MTLSSSSCYPPDPKGGRSLLLAPCLAQGPSPAQFLQRAVLEARLRQVEDENRRLRLQLSQSQDGNYGNQQWAASADTAPEDGDTTAEDRGNSSQCQRAAAVHKCEVSDLVSWSVSRSVSELVIKSVSLRLSPSVRWLVGH